MNHFGAVLEVILESFWVFVDIDFGMRFLAVENRRPEGQVPQLLGRPGGMRGGTGEGTLGEGAENFA